MPLSPTFGLSSLAGSSFSARDSQPCLIGTQSQHHSVTEDLQGAAPYLSCLFISPNTESTVTERRLSEVLGRALVVSYTEIPLCQVLCPYLGTSFSLHNHPLK